MTPAHQRSTDNPQHLSRMPHNEEQDQGRRQSSGPVPRLVRARVHDAEGSIGRRLFRTLGPVWIWVLLDLTQYTPFGTWYCGLPHINIRSCETLYQTFDALWCVLALIWPWILPRRKSQVRTIALGNGFIRLGAKGWWHERINPKQILALRMASVKDGTSVLIVRKHGSAVFLELERRDDAAAIVEALGGSKEPLEIHSEDTWKDHVRAVVDGGLRAVGIVACLVAMTYFWEFWLRVPHLDLMEKQFVVMDYYTASIWDWLAVQRCLRVAYWCIGLGFVLRLHAHDTRGIRLQFGPTALMIGDGVSISYATIDSIKTNKRILEIRVLNKSEPIRVRPPGFSHEEVEHLAVHVIDMVRKSKLPVQENEPHDESHGVFGKRKNEATREWMTRLDLFAQDGCRNPYRDVPLNRKTLASTIADSEAPIVVRTGAARVLWRIDPKIATEAVNKLDKNDEADMRERLEAVMQADSEAASEEYDQLPPPFRVFSPRD
mgnify:CR=1 FL=1